MTDLPYLGLISINVISYFKHQYIVQKSVEIKKLGAEYVD